MSAANVNRPNELDILSNYSVTAVTNHAFSVAEVHKINEICMPLQAVSDKAKSGRGK